MVGDLATLAASSSNCGPPADAAGGVGGKGGLASGDCLHLLTGVHVHPHAPAMHRLCVSSSGQLKVWVESQWLEAGKGRVGPPALRCCWHMGGSCHAGALRMAATRWSAGCSRCCAAGKSVSPTGACPPGTVSVMSAWQESHSLEQGEGLNHPTLNIRLPLLLTRCFFAFPFAALMLSLQTSSRPCCYPP